MRPISRRRFRAYVSPIHVIATMVLAMILGCSSAKEFVALRRVEFRFDSISDSRLVGIPLHRVHSYTDLGATDLARLGVAIIREDVPIDLTVHIEGRNPESNNVTARMVGMGWAYLVDDREVVSGRLSGATSFPPGEPRDVPLLVTFNLMDMFGDRRRDLVEVALALAGQRSSVHRVAMRLTPAIETRGGRIRYPVPITLDLSSPPAR